MRWIAEAYLGIHLDDFLFAGFHKFIRFFKAFLDKPFLRGEITDFLEIALERGEATASIVGY